MSERYDKYGTLRADPYSTHGRYRLWWRAVNRGVRTDVLGEAYGVSADAVCNGVQAYRRHLEQA